MPEYVTVFDIMQEGFTEWRIIFSVLHFLILGIISLVIRYLFSLFRKSNYRLKHWDSLAVIMILFAMVVLVTMSYTKHDDALAAYANNDYEIAEGAITIEEGQVNNGIERWYQVGDLRLWDKLYPQFVGFRAKDQQPGLKKIRLKKGRQLRIAYVYTSSGSPSVPTFLKVEIAKL